MLDKKPKYPREIKRLGKDSNILYTIGKFGLAIYVQVIKRKRFYVIAVRGLKQFGWKETNRVPWMSELLIDKKNKQTKIFGKYNSEWVNF